MKKIKISDLKENKSLTEKIKKMARNTKEVEITYIYSNDFIKDLGTKIKKIENELSDLKSMLKKVA